MGSPPRMREEFHNLHLRLIHDRITPAHAGRMLGLRRILAVTEDHPRACGKNYTCFTTITLTQGSPPRMREELNKGNTTSSLERITPAHAGRIFILMKYILVIQDHPRACGKNFESAAYVARYVGSPPRMREEFCCSISKVSSGGITPAHAGRIQSGI